MPNSHSAVLGVVALSFAAATAIARDDCKFSADRHASLDTSGAERIEISARAGTDIRARRDGNSVRVFVVTPDELVGFGNVYSTLDLRVDVPAGVPVEVTDSSGDMTIDGVRVTRITDSSGDIVALRLPADVEIGDSSGDIRVEDAAGGVTITDSSGDIHVRGAKDVHIPRDSSGSIDIEQISGGSVRIYSDSSGDITITRVGHDVAVLADSSGDVRVSDVQGSISIPRSDH
jgi:hypothetical protein